MELISVNLLWDTYLQRMAMEVERGEWIALWGLINMLQILVAIVSGLGETGLKVIYLADCQNEVQATGDMALIGHEAELHYHSLERIASQIPQLAIAEEVKQKYGHGKITEEICPKCGRNSSATHKVFLRAVEHCSTTQTTVSFVIVASWMNFSWESGAKKKNKQCRMLGGNLLV